METEPVPKLRARGRRNPKAYLPGRKGRRIIFYTPKRTREFERTIAWAWKRRYGSLRLGGPLAVGILLEAPSKRGDIDNLTKSSLDGLRDAFDDRQVEALLVVYLRSPRPRVNAVILPWKAEAAGRIIGTLADCLMGGPEDPRLQSSGDPAENV